MTGYGSDPPASWSDLARLVMNWFNPEAISRTYEETHHKGLPKAFRHEIRELELSFRYLAEHFGEPADFADKAVHIASLLLMAGASDQDWKRWLALAAFGWSGSRPNVARAYGVLSNEWIFLKELPEPSANSELADLVVARLLGSKVAIKGDGTTYEGALVQLSESIPRKNHPVTEAAFEALGEFWIEMATYLEDPDPSRYPPFEPTPAALGALAWLNGYRPNKLSDEIRQFLKVGFSDDEGERLYGPGGLSTIHFDQ